MINDDQLNVWEALDQVWSGSCKLPPWFDQYCLYWSCPLPSVEGEQLQYRKSRTTKYYHKIFNIIINTYMFVLALGVDHI